MDLRKLVEIVILYTFSLSVTPVLSRGGDPDGSSGIGLTSGAAPENTKEVVSRDPRPLHTYLPYRTNDNAYTDGLLGIFGEYYHLYKPFMSSATYKEMAKSLKNDTKVCANFNVNINGTYFGFIKCPLPFEPEDYNWCCGAPYAEMCCFDTDAFHYEVWVGGLVFGGCIIFVLLLGAMCYGVLGQGWCRKSDGRPSSDEEK